MRTVQKVDGLYRCIECGQESPDQSAPHRGRCSCYAASLPPRRARDDGPGTELKALLKDWLGIEASPTCSCNAMARRMNQQGPEWCESDEGMAEILGVMRAEHAKRWEAGKTRLPWADIGARQLVRLASRRARAKASA